MLADSGKGISGIQMFDLSLDRMRRRLCSNYQSTLRNFP